MPETHIRARFLLGCRSAGARCLCARQNQTFVETSDSERDPLVTSALIVLTQAGNVLMGTAPEARTSAGINTPHPPPPPRRSAERPHKTRLLVELRLF